MEASRGPLVKLFSLITTCAFFSAFQCHAQSDCKPSPAGTTTVVDLGPIKSVTGDLADFNPCHRSVSLDTPGFFAPKRGTKPPLVIVVHGGGGLGGYETEFARLMNKQGFATLVFDAFEMNGLSSGSNLVTYQMSNAARQKMLYKVALGAYSWAIRQEKIDASRIFVQGLSNGGSVSINLAGAVDPAHVKGVIAEGSPSAGIGFPNALKVPLLMLYGSADVYGSVVPNDFMHLRGNPCPFNDFYALAPAGFGAICNKENGYNKSMPSPLSWFQGMKEAGFDIRFELIEGGGHGMMFSDFSSSVRKVGYSVSYQSRGANVADRQRLQKLIIDFIESKL
jgi:dienelactone hydrolase